MENLKEYNVRNVDDVLKLLLQVTIYIVKICTSLLFTMYREVKMIVLTCDFATCRVLQTEEWQQPT